MSSLECRVAVVSGGARGIGAAIVRCLHRRGASVLIADSGTSIGGIGGDPSPARALADELGARADAYTESLASPSTAQAAIDRCRANFGAVDLLVNNAAILRDAFIFKAAPRDWEAVIATNLSTAFYLCNAATPHMRTQAKAGRGDGHWGRIVNIVSSAGFYGNYGQVAYASAKAGLMGLTRVVALDMARSGVTCNAIAPFAATRVTEIIRPANDEQAKYKERALKISADHVADLAAYLSSAAAQAITGQLFGVRGRELFLFGQARPRQTVVAPDDRWSDETLTAAMTGPLAPGLEPLTTDLETFNTEPVV